MGYRPSDKDVESEHRAARRKLEEARRALCVDAVTKWNELMGRRFKPNYSPAIGVAIEAGFYFLDVSCPGCGQQTQVDLRTLGKRWHPQTAIFGLIPSLSCRNCQPHPPFARIRSLSVVSWESPNAPVALPSRRP